MSESETIQTSVEQVVPIRWKLKGIGMYGSDVEVVSAEAYDALKAQYQDVLDGLARRHAAGLIPSEEDGEYVDYVDAGEALAAFLDVLIGVRTINEAMSGLGFETRRSEDIFNRLATGEILPVP